MTDHDPHSIANYAEPILPETLAARGPCVIGATGGSGTRVVARIVRHGGMYIGSDLNRSEDAIEFGAYSDRWINRYRAGEGSPTSELEAEMTADLRAILAAHCAGVPDTATRWGWKEPRSIYLLRFFRSRMASLRFLHFVRDGRDMAFSDNQFQLKKHGSAVLDGRVSWRRPVRSIALWTRVNQETADFGERELGPDYLRVRFEDLCAEPGLTVERIFDFFDLEGDVKSTASEVQPPATLGRWRERPQRVMTRLEHEAEPALRRFGYL